MRKGGEEEDGTKHDWWLRSQPELEPKALAAALAGGRLVVAPEPVARVLEGMVRRLLAVPARGAGRGARGGPLALADVVAADANVANARDHDDLLEAAGEVEVLAPVLPLQVGLAAVCAPHVATDRRRGNGLDRAEHGRPPRAVPLHALLHESARARLVGGSFVNRFRQGCTEAVREQDRVGVDLDRPIVALVAPVFPDRFPHVHEELRVSCGTVLRHTHGRGLERNQIPRVYTVEADLLLAQYCEVVTSEDAHSALGLGVHQVRLVARGLRHREAEDRGQPTRRPHPLLAGPLAVAVGVLLAEKPLCIPARRRLIQARVPLGVLLYAVLHHPAYGAVAGVAVLCRLALAGPRAPAVGILLVQVGLDCLEGGRPAKASVPGRVLGQTRLEHPRHPLEAYRTSRHLVAVLLAATAGLLGLVAAGAGLLDPVGG
mmetsp:Transcript_29665/g.83362  ORF Transcript_29665/g.83362 Transcript_29665/m.83362 type:complete len:432 (+) Transcript_29665:323-1618(+)